MTRSVMRAIVAAGIVWTAACGGNSMPPTSPAPPAPAPATPPPPPAPVAPPKATDGASFTVTRRGFVNDPSSPYQITDLHIYQGGRLTVTNTDTEPHDILSDPPHIHTDCPEMNTAGYLVPGQTHVTDPFNRLVTCGFHDHT